MKRKLWLWFIGGFLVMFASLALFKPVNYIPPSEDRIIKMKLWEFYRIEVPKSWHRELRPLNSMTTALPRLVFSHLVASTIGGVTVLTVAWSVQRLTNRTSPSTA